MPGTWLSSHALGWHASAHNGAHPPLFPQGPIEPCSPSNPTECTGGGECFFEYSEDQRDVHEFGPCTKDGRASLLGTPGLSIEQINKYNETCGGLDPSEGSGFKYYPAALVKAPQFLIFDGGGYVRDVRPDEPLPGADIPRVPKVGTDDL